MSVVDLPTDILVLIFPYLSARDFLAFTSSSKDFLSFRQEPAYWRSLTTKTFRIPPQRLLQTDGARWQWLYKSLLTQSYVYTWGNDERGNLGHGNDERRAFRTRVQRFHIRRDAHNDSLYPDGWPTQIWDQDTVGVIADVQCG